MMEATCSGTGEVEMPKYTCHKQVWALLIEEVVTIEAGFGFITPANRSFAPFQVDSNYMDKHKPKKGGYYVVYEDGYKSFSPASAFEKGYTKVEA